MMKRKLFLKLSRFSRYFKVVCKQVYGFFLSRQTFKSEDYTLVDLLLSLKLNLCLQGLPVAYQE